MLACETGCCYCISRTVLHQETSVARGESEITGKWLSKGEAMDVAHLPNKPLQTGRVEDEAVEISRSHLFKLLIQVCVKPMG